MTEIRSAPARDDPARAAVPPSSLRESRKPSVQARPLWPPADSIWRSRKANRLAYPAGYTGLGVGATRFGADVMLDLMHIGLASGEETERTRLAILCSKLVPFPPEVFRYGVIALTRREIARADRNADRCGLWLRALDRFGTSYSMECAGRRAIGSSRGIRRWCRR